MANANQNNIALTYFELLQQQNFQLDKLDYSLLEKHKSKLQIIADISNCGVSVFDLFKKEHVFFSPNFGALLGYDLNNIMQQEHDYWDSLIHPDDYIMLMEVGITLLKLFFKLNKEDKINHKLVNDYRILNANGEYVRVIEQHQALELDEFGNLWLSLSIIDISPNQDISHGLKSQLLNFKSGKIIPFNDDKRENENISIVLSKRELQILQMVRDGLLSKEISNELDISLHTVNTHRQRVLEKLGANNSMEAVVFASRLGLLQ
ncbi:MAG: PAS domain-containing protein [Desulfobulbaceae bacterium]|nr:PAS domain-containing protein [Desulfobulbaceae bacterium]